MVEILRDLARQNELAILPRIFDYVFHSDPEIAQAAVTTVNRLYEVVLSEDLIGLDESFRSWHESGYRRDVGVKEINALKTMHPDGSLLYALSSFNRNGKARESAIEHLAEICEGWTLPFFLLRVNDWVPQVRSRAIAAVENLMSPRHGHDFAVNLPLIQRLTDCTRADHKSFVDHIYNFLSSEVCSKSLQLALRHPNHKVRRCAFEFSLAPSFVHRSAILPLGLRDPDSLIRIKTARSIVTSGSRNEISEYLPQMRRDKFVAVRRMGYLASFESDNSMPDIFSDGLVDANPGIRQMTRFFWKRDRDPAVDFVAIYESFLSTTSESLLAIVIAGIGETGSLGDCDTIEQFLNSTSVGIQKAAIQSVDFLNGKSFLSQFLKLLRSDSPGVSRIASSALAKYPADIDYDSLTVTFSECSHVFQRANILYLLDTASKWDRITYFVELTTTNGPVIQRYLTGYINKWIHLYNHSFIQPKPHQIDRLRETLGGSFRLLTREQTQFLKDLVKLYSCSGDAPAPSPDECELEH